MKQYEMTLAAVSEKRVRISAESAEAAAEMVEKIYSETNILDFTDREEMNWKPILKSCVKILKIRGMLTGSLL